MFLQQARQEGAHALPRSRQSPPSLIPAPGYSIFAVVQRDLGTELALPRVDVDEFFASIPEESPHGFASSASASARARNHADYVVEGLEDEDMLQAALRASLETISACPVLPRSLSPQQP